MVSLKFMVWVPHRLHAFLSLTKLAAGQQRIRSSLTAPAPQSSSRSAAAIELSNEFDDFAPETLDVLAFPIHYRGLHLHQRAIGQGAIISVDPRGDAH